METRKVRADELRSPLDEGDVVRKGSQVLLDGRPFRVTQMTVNPTTGFVALRFASVQQSNELSSSSHYEEAAPGKMFDEIVEQ